MVRNMKIIKFLLKLITILTFYILIYGFSYALYINKTGNTGLSKGGAGDLLSGIIAGLTPSMCGNLFNSAVLGAFVHGMSADLLKNEMSEYSILPSDCGKILGKVYALIEDEKD